MRLAYMLKGVQAVYFHVERTAQPFKSKIVIGDNLWMIQQFDVWILDIGNYYGRVY